MSTGYIELVLDVEGAEGWVLHQHVLLKQAEAADVEGGGVGGRPGYQAPVQLVPSFQSFQIPHILAQPGVGLLLLVFEAGEVVAPPELPAGLGPPQVGLHLEDPWVLLHLVHQSCSLGRLCLDLCLANNILCQALSSQWWTVGLILLLLVAAASPLPEFPVCTRH